MESKRNRTTTREWTDSRLVSASPGLPAGSSWMSLGFLLCLCLVFVASPALAAKNSIIRIIIVQNRAEAENILSEIRSGRSFASLAKEKSIDEKSRSRYGEIDPADFTGLAAPLKEAALRLEEGKVSGVISLGDNRYALALAVDLSDYRQGSRAFRSRDFRTAEKDLVRHVDANPDAVKARIMLGQIYESKKDLEKAGANYRDALRFDPVCKDAYERLGALYLRQGAFQQARDLYQEGLRRIPGAPFLKAGLEKAEAGIPAPKKEPPKDAAAAKAPPRTDMTQAAPLSSEIARMAPSKAEPSKTIRPRSAQDRDINLRIIVTRTEADAKDILAQLKTGKPFALLAKERSIDEKSRGSYGYLGEISVNSLTSSLQDALAKLKEGQTSGVVPFDSGRYAIVQITDMTLFREGEKAFISGDFATAEKKLLKYIEPNPDSVRARTMLAKISEERKELSKAIEMYQTAISYSPKTVLLYERLARDYLLIGQYQKAKAVYIEGLRQVPSSHEMEEGIEMADILMIGRGEKAP